MALNIIPITARSSAVAQSTPADNNKFKFTVKRLQDLPASAATILKGKNKGELTNTYYWDTQQGGLCLRVTPKGAKSYVLRRRINGKSERITLGKFDAITLQAARDAAGRYSGKIAAGVDVIAERKAARTKGVTAGELFTAWLRGAKTRQLRTWAEDERLWELHLKKKFKSTEAGAITSLDIQRLIDKIGKDKPRTANKCAALLSRIFNYSIKRGLFTSINPCQAVDRMPEQSRDRFLKPDEIPVLIDAVMGEEEPWRGYFLMLLYTGARRSSVLGMQWRDIDLDGGVWHLPAWASKNGKAVTIALTLQAVELLQGVLPDKINDFVFPSITSDSGHIETPTKPWKRICERAGFDDLRIHDIRRTVGSHLAASGANGFVISKALGHINPRSAEVYARLTVDPVREALSGIQAGWADDAVGGE